MQQTVTLLSRLISSSEPNLDDIRRVLSSVTSEKQLQAVFQVCVWSVQTLRLPFDGVSVQLICVVSTLRPRSAPVQGGQPSRVSLIAA